MIGLYNLANRPATFDIAQFCAVAGAYGVDHVRFVLGAWKKKNYTIAQAEERFRSIVEPMPALFGMTYSIGEPEGVEFDHMISTVIRAYQKQGTLGHIAYPCEDKGYVTVTLRNSRTPERNTKDDEWKKFAARCDREVIILPDYDDKPLSLRERMALYAGAHLNLMINNGPGALCAYSDAPFISMRTIGCERSMSAAPWFMERMGITPGFQFPWSKPNQRLSYLDDTLENIEAEYAAFEERQKVRKAA